MPYWCSRATALLAALPLALIGTQVAAHTGEGINTGFASGF